MTKYKGTLNLSFNVEANDEDEARNKVDWLINEAIEEGAKQKIKILKVSL